MTAERLARPEARRELSEFVRYCREHASPQELGLAVGSRRRTKGLRREEVATLAGVGLTWYTWFEQGRDIQVSDDFLNRLGRGLRLDRAELEHLHALAGRAPCRAETQVAALPAGLLAIINALPDPAYILNKRWDVLAFNEAALELLPMFGEQDPNLLRIVFFSDSYRESVRNWDTAARIVFLKARHDYLTGGADPILRRLLDEIVGRFPPAQAWWTDPEAVRIGDSRKELYSQEKGWQTFQLSVLAYEERPEIRVVVYGQEHPHQQR